MTTSQLLSRVKDELRRAFGNRLEGVVLFGSEARREAKPDSDIDLLVLLAGPIDLGKDLETSIHALYPLVLETERPIDVMPVDAAAYATSDNPLFVKARKEGIAA